MQYISNNDDNSNSCSFTVFTLSLTSFGGRKRNTLSAYFKMKHNQYYSYIKKKKKKKKKKNVPCVCVTTKGYVRQTCVTRVSKPSLLLLNHIARSMSKQTHFCFRQSIRIYLRNVLSVSLMRAVYVCMCVCVVVYQCVCAIYYTAQMSATFDKKKSFFQNCMFFSRNFFPLAHSVVHFVGFAEKSVQFQPHY